MANIKSQIKRIKTNEKARERNKAVKSELKSFVRKTREAIAAHGVSVWLKAELDLLMDRVSKKQNRPLLKSADPRAVLERLMGERYPVYATSDVTVPTRDDRKEVIAAEVIEALGRHFGIDEIAATGEVRS